MPNHPLLLHPLLLAAPPIGGGPTGSQRLGEPDDAVYTGAAGRGAGLMGLGQTEGGWREANREVQRAREETGTVPVTIAA